MNAMIVIEKGKAKYRLDKNKKKETNVSKGVDVLIKALRKDKGLYWAYQSNIAMAFYDAMRDVKMSISRDKFQEKCNIAARYFLDLLCKK